jgi:type IV secretory pathway component VirB8
MKAKIFIYLLIVGGALITMALLPSQQEEKFYYAFDKKTTLIAKTNTILVKYIEGIDKTKAVESIERLSPDFNIK